MALWQIHGGIAFSSDIRPECIPVYGRTPSEGYIQRYSTV